MRIAFSNLIKNQYESKVKESEQITRSLAQDMVIQQEQAVKGF